MITGKNYIGDERIAKGNKTYKTFNPKENKETPYSFYEATEDEINQAVELASEAFQTYKNVSGAKKADFLNAIAEEIEALGDLLIETYVAESGLPEGRAKGERGRTMGQLRAFASLLQEGSWVEATIDTAQPKREPLPKPDIRKMLFPIGPVVVFGASNFPLAFSTAGGDTASALAAGCPVIVKSHPMHAGTGELVAEAIIKAAKKTGMPNGVFSNLNSSGIEVGQQLVKHPTVKAVGFTGSIKGGTALSKLAQERKEPIPVYAEMGSINPVVILPSALKEHSSHWAQQYAASITLGAGQFCTNPGLLLAVKSDALNGFITQLGKEISQIAPTAMLHPNICDTYQKNMELASAQDKTKLVGAYEGQASPNFGKQKVLTVNGQEFLKNTLLHQEVFGPYSLVVQCENDEELKHILEALEGQLTGTVLGNKDELKNKSALIDALKERVGRLILNSVPTGVEVCPSMHHGGPFPATTDAKYTSVGVAAIKRWVRPVAYQNWPVELLPQALQNTNPLKVMRLVNGEYSNKPI
ncbi:aldehyde dehydrogenase (NADP(+)) [Galbibacter sp. BG1]|uniref:aldehyde dehydrogenase (NADP(+)) n=1 Tax=Galbibacter sp. BG1 TaxID=1170699 RepID=UPI0015BF181E|nr:aldehyde dehydrogenase (NADP(+)) [Galbibacter sp. BG1]QLE01012.1 aldehyde dehydrogenase (NADP(+)) [Galbibacter sp. BG1]